jgi:hypothetical protein
MALPATTSSVVAARLTASGVSRRKIITRWAAGVVPTQRIFIEDILANHRPQSGRASTKCCVIPARRVRFFKKKPPLIRVSSGQWKTGFRSRLFDRIA